MAATELIADGTTVANSSDFTLVGTTDRTLYLRYTPGTSSDVKYYIQHKNSDGTYTTKIVLTPKNDPLTLDGTGVFRAQRQASAASSALDID
jgi:hypothetical protein